MCGGESWLRNFLSKNRLEMHFVVFLVKLLSTPPPPESVVERADCVVSWIRTL